MLAQFESSSFRMSLRVFLDQNHSICSLDDDLIGTQGRDIPVRTLSARKADKKGHSSDVVADALFRFVLQLRFRRRGESHMENVKKLLSPMMDHRGDNSLKGVLLMVDRGYGTEKMLEEIAKFGVSRFVIMPDHSLKCHPFVAKSRFKLDRSEASSSLSNEKTNVGNGSGEQFLYDMPGRFVIDDDPSLGPASFRPIKSVSRKQTQEERREAIAVREYGSKAHCKVLRFMYYANG